MALLGLVLGCTPAPQPGPEASPPSPTGMVSPPPSSPLPREQRHSPALDALRAGRIREARELATQAASQDPKSVDAQTDLAEVQFVAGDYQGSLEAARRAMELAPQGRNEAQVFALVRAQMLIDPAQALQTMQSAPPGVRGRPGFQVMEADASLFVAAGEEDPDARKKAAEKARQALAAMKPEPGRPALDADRKAVLANSYYVEGNLAEARKLAEEAVQQGVGMADRESDLHNFLAWIAFLQGDEKRVRTEYDAALKTLQGSGQVDAFLLLPKWEVFLFFQSAFGGVELDRAKLESRAPALQKLLGQGLVDNYGYDQDRQLFAALLEAREKGDYPTAFYLLGHQVVPPVDTAEVPVRDLATGDAPEPVCFYKAVVEDRQVKVFAPIFLGDVAAKGGDKAMAAWWYRQALGLVPGNPILEARLKKTGAPGSKPPSLKSPDPAQTLRMLARFAKEGNLAGLYPGLEVLAGQGVTFRDLARMKEANDPVWREVSGDLAKAERALAKGAKFRRQPVGEQKAEEDGDTWGSEDAFLDYGEPRPLRLTLEEERWRVREFGRPLLPLIERWRKKQG